MSELLRLDSGAARVEIDSTEGATLMSYELSDGRQVLRPCPDGTAFQGCFIMAPWTNRLSGGVTVGGEFAALEPNLEQFPLPIHGYVAQQSWEITASESTFATLTTSVSGPAPFAFDASVTYRLDATALTILLELTHRGDEPVPYGMGIHPWFPRTGQVSIRAHADNYFETGSDMLPSGRFEVSNNPAWDFSDGRDLPDDLIDTCFGGWDGSARIETPDWAMDVETDPPCGWYQIYSPSKDADFFCFEPVTHPVNAHNEPGHPGLVQLARGESMRQSIAFSPF